MGEPVSNGECHVLLVEDDEDMVTLLRFLLEREGHKVSHVSDGSQAKELIGQIAPPQLVLLDVMLPYHNGVEILKHMRSNTAWSKVPIIMLTSLSAEQNIIAMLDDGANDYIVKPFKPHELTARVRRLLKPWP